MQMLGITVLIEKMVRAAAVKWHRHTLNIKSSTNEAITIIIKFCQHFNSSILTAFVRAYEIKA